MKYLTKIILILFFIPAVLLSQNSEGLKQAAIGHMNAGRFGEAIDLLNKYISANPRVAEGYNLRGLSFEKRSQYQNAVLDFRRARKLDPNNKEIRENLARVIEIWHAQLYKKIQGHEREIAIDPTNPFNYLEIGKSYRWLEEWDLAEEWYDKYLERDDNASPDEIIRYSEILAKNEHIKKGEIILKKYVERYPEDWRLWSKYGYFTMWLGNNKNAINAFETALSFKPFFKEAQDGLDLAKKEAYLTQYDPRSFEPVYAIDRYYNRLKRNPDDYGIRFKLVNELIKEERIEEALDQLLILGVDHSDDERYDPLFDFVSTFRDSVYRTRLENYEAVLENDPGNKEAVKNAAQYYEYLQEYDNAVYVLDNYFEEVPNETDKDLRYDYARALAWSRDFDKAIEVIDGLLEEYPDNLDYQLFRAQLSIWNTRDIELAREYLDNVLAQDSNVVDALIAKGSLYLLDRDFESAQEFADRASNLDPLNDEVIKLQSNIDFQKLRVEEERLYQILEEGRTLVVDGDCEGALPFYEDYIDQAEPNIFILKEYGDVLFCAERFEEAKAMYEEVLIDGYNYEAALQSAKVSYAMGDSLGALMGFRTLVKEEPEEFEPRLYLADTYAKLNENDSARVIYDSLLTTWDLDSNQTSMVEQRLDWLPVTGLRGILATFPSTVGLAPSVSWYTDDLSFGFTNWGGRLELGVLEFLSIGVTFQRHFLTANEESLDEDVVSTYTFTGDRKFTIFEGHIFLRLGDYVSTGVGMGVVNVSGSTTQTQQMDIFARYEPSDNFFVQGTITNSDAALILYSPYLIDNRYTSRYYRVEGRLLHKSGFLVKSHFQYLTVNDSNEGNDFMLRVGRRFEEYLFAGYEYLFANYRFDSDLYYSPNNYESHSFWVDIPLEEKDELEVTIGGKVGYVPSNDFIILSGNIDATVKIDKNLLLTGRTAVGSTTRDDASYRFLSGQISLYWNIF
ncbi:MAG: tetratricopeptide repeat protein [Ignavibacteria bacterium]|jgi:tetratricopeptide (TPR) repeat protein